MRAPFICTPRSANADGKWLGKDFETSVEREEVAAGWAREDVSC
jgi:hypothetical protein